MTIENNNWKPVDNSDGSRSYIKQAEKLTDLDHVDIIQGQLVKLYSTYCTSCGKTKTSGLKPVDLAMNMFEEGWRATDPYNIKCPECSKLL